MGAKDFIGSLFLKELFKGMAVTGRYMFARKITIQYPGREDAAEQPFPRPARAAPLPERRRALHRLQAVRGRLPGNGDHHRIRRA
jgi:formate hydrogenlyase subunit 6/NADH:ubiquinone oxidoreductase subunit I